MSTASVTVAVGALIGGVLGVVVGCNSCARSQHQAPAAPVSSSPAGDTPTPDAVELPAPESAPATVAASPAELAIPVRARSAGLGRQTLRVAGPCTGAAAGARAVICVDDEGPATGAAGTASAPHRTIGDAIRAARSGATIRVAAGTYRENVAVRDKTLTIIGGFAGGAAADFNTHGPAEHVSTIAGVGGDAAVVLIDSGRTRIEGFRVVSGTGNPLQKKWFYLGGGFYISGGAPTIARNLIESNDIVSSHPGKDVENVGAGIFAEEARVTIVSNLIRDNRTGRGALATRSGTALIQDNQIVDNVAIGDHGGGVYVSGPQIKLLRNYVANNRIQPRQGHGGWGGGIMVYDRGTRAELRGNVVTGNHAPEIGSGTFVDDGAVATLHNELVFANRCPRIGGAGVYVDGLDRKTRSSARLVNVTIAQHRCGRGRGHGIYVENASVTVENSIIWGNGGDALFTDPRATLAVSHSLTEARVTGPGNLVGRDPLFAAPERGDFHLRSRAGRWDPSLGRWEQDTVHSPGIDAADPRATVGDEPAANGDRRNLGAFGGTDQASRSLTTRGGSG